MTSFKFIIRSLAYFKKQHIGVFLATLLSSAVLTGALIIGDSVKHSLLHLVELRLGNVENVLVTGDRFVSDQLSKKISNDLNISTASVLSLESIAIVPDNKVRVPGVKLLGIDNDFWDISDITLPHISNKEVIISQNLAIKLDINIGDEFLLRVRNVDLVPVNAPFSSDSDEDQTIALRLRVAHIANDNELGKFSLKNNQKAPYNIFIDRTYISQKVDLPNRSNLIVTSINSNVDIKVLNESLARNFTTEDAEIQISKIDSSSAIDLISNRIFIDNSISDNIEKSTIHCQNILTYFVNSFNYDNRKTPYSFVSAVSDNYYNISETGIIINSWLANDLDANIGDSITLDYFVIGPMRSLKEKSNIFVVQDIIPVNQEPKNRALMPNFPGLSNAESCGDWDAGIPIDLTEIRDKDEDYWNNYKGTPKAYISLGRGTKLWENQFGNYTTIRFDSNEISKLELTKRIDSILSPSELGITFIDVRSNGNNAASNGVDFGELFLSLSFFIIISALLLTVLIFSLNLSSRMYEVGILSSLGLTRKQIIRLRLSESLLIILLAAIIGGIAGISYNNVILAALNSIWNDAIHADLIRIQIIPKTIITGILISIITSLLSIYITTLRMLKKTTVSLVKQDSTSIKKGKQTLSKLFAIIGLVSSLSIVLISLLTEITISSALTLSAAFLFILGSVSSTNIIIGFGLTKPASGISNSVQLAFKNLGRHKGRSITVISLLAIGTATVVLTGSNRLTFHGSENQRQSGTGGFTYWVENTIPILQELNSETGKTTYGLDEEYFDETRFVQFNSIAGDDASCLNLNQVNNPQLLGVNPQLFDSLQSFSFSTFINRTESPWLELTNNYGENTIAAIADQTVIQWGLMKSIGDTLHYINEHGDSLNLILVGGLAPSIFQGNILIADSLFLTNFPSSAGSNIMLVETTSKSASEVKESLQNNFTDFGIEITSASQRLMDFYSVTNTYLTIFMILGGLGVIIGTFGLGIVIIRNLLDRKHEIDMYYALGFTKKLIFNIFFIENLTLLMMGIIIGLLASIIGIIPSLTSPSYNIPGNFIFIIISIIFVNGLVWILVPTIQMLKNSKTFNLREDQ